MAKKLRYLFYTFICLILFTLLVSLFLSVLYIFNIFSAYLNLFSKILGYLIIIICAILLGKNIKEKTIYYAFMFSLFCFLISLFFVDKNMIDILLLCCKWFIFIIVAMLSRK